MNFLDLEIEIDELEKDGTDKTPVVDFALETQASWYPTVKSIQDSYKLTNPKYKQYLRDELKPNTEVHEYVGPNGTGYVIFEYETREDGEYVRAAGKGAETWRYFDWVLNEIT